jgi:hypothetical protein
MPHDTTHSVAAARSVFRRKRRDFLIDESFRLLEL